MVSEVGAMACIQKRSGKYRARITRQGHPIYSRTFTRKADAERWARETEIAIENGAVIPKSRDLHPLAVYKEPSLHEIAEHYIDHHSPQKRNTRSEIGILKALQRRWPDRSASSIQKSDILLLRDELKSLGRSGDTINHYLNAVSVIYKTAASELFEGLTNPTVGVKRMPQGKGRVMRLGEKARALLLTRCQESSHRLLYPAVFLALETGMRRGELLSIDWRDVDLEHRRILVRETKNGEHRSVPLTLPALELLKLTDPDHRKDKVIPIAAESMRKQFERLVKKAAKEWAGKEPNPFESLRFHDLRHEALSQLSDRGLNVIELSQISGHKTLRMLQRYTHPLHSSLLRKLDGENMPTG